MYRGRLTTWMCGGRESGVGVPRTHGYVRSYFVFDVKQAVKAS